MARHRTRHPPTVLLTAVLFATALLTACGGAAPDEGLRPLGADPGDPAGPATTPGPSTTGPSTTAASATAPTTGAPADGTDPVDGPTRDLVDAVLARYDRALTDLAARPTGLDDPADLARVAWDAVLVPGSVLAADVTGRIRTRAADGVVVVPPPSGDLSFVHRVLDLVSSGPDGAPAGPGATEVSFTWCGWSPGIGRRAADGAVVDDTVAHSRGTGRIVADGAGWRLAALDETELVVLGPGAADPCLAEARAAAVGR